MPHKDPEARRAYHRAYYQREMEDPTVREKKRVYSLAQYYKHKAEGYAPPPKSEEQLERDRVRALAYYYERKAECGDTYPGAAARRVADAKDFSCPAGTPWTAPTYTELSREQYDKDSRTMTRKRWKDKQDPALEMWRSARNSARRWGRELTITPEDIEIPDVCPVLGIELCKGEGSHHANSPSLDRFDNTKGYVKGNVRVISNRANSLKKDGTLEELRAVVKYMEGGL